MRAAIYCRVSVDDRAVSLDAQEAGAREWCARQGHVVVAVHRDDGISGAEWDRRPGVQRVRAAVRIRAVSENTRGGGCAGVDTSADRI